MDEEDLGEHHMPGSSLMANQDGSKISEIDKKA